MCHYFFQKNLNRLIISIYGKSIYTKQLNQVLSLLKELRLKSGYTQNDLAKLLDKPQSFVSKYESGERRLDIIELRTICKALRITFSDFINRLEGILMIPNKKFTNLSKDFWANIRSISQQTGYTIRGEVKLRYLLLQK